MRIGGLFFLIKTWNLRHNLQKGKKGPSDPKNDQNRILCDQRFLFCLKTWDFAR